MLRASSISKRFGADSVLHDVSFVVPPGARYGLVGANGTGKTTLLNILAGVCKPDTGSVTVHPPGSVAYMPQASEADVLLTAREYMLRSSGRIGELATELERLHARMSIASSAEMPRLLARLAAQTEAFEALDGYAHNVRIESVATGLGVDLRDLDMSIASLSGGTRTKLSVARLLLAEAQVYLLDEPTNFLDLPALLWLEDYIVRSDRSYLIVSHDRRFLDRTVNHILEIGSKDHSVRQWAGNYSAYEAARCAEQLKARAAYRDQQAEIARIEADIRHTKDQARGVEARSKSGPGADHQRRLAKKVARKAKARERRLHRELERDHVDKPQPQWQLNLTGLATAMTYADRSVLSVEDLSVRFGTHDVLRGINLSLRGDERVALLGENGSGKSTVLRCIVGAIAYLGRIAISSGIRPGYLSQENDELGQTQSALEVFRMRTASSEQDARTYLHKFLFAGADVFKPVGTLSLGQQAKLALALVLASDCNFLILDEPTSHMDIPALVAIEDALSGYRGPMLVVSHDRHFLSKVGIHRAVRLHDGHLHDIRSMEEYEQSVVAHARDEEHRWVRSPMAL